MKKYLPPVITLLIFLATVLFLAFYSAGLTEGKFFYTLDDPYIHMAIAKNFVNSGTWGVTQHEFTSCSSSPLWTFLISVFYFAFGINAITPFILNIIFAGLTVVFAHKLIDNLTESTILKTIILLTVLFFGPFISVVFTGLEHSMYSFLIATLIFYLYRIFGGSSKKKDIYILFILVMLLALTRYEGMFITGAIFLVFLFKKRISVGIGVLLSGLLPVIIIGTLSVLKGWYFFPNSVILKSPVEASDFGSVITSLFNPDFFEILWAYKRILILLIFPVLILIIYRRDEELNRLRPLTFIFILIVILQIQYAKLGSLMRYEMYIIIFGILINSVSILKYIKGRDKRVRIPVILFLCMVIIPFSVSPYGAARDVPTAMTNIYQMQYQMSRFISKYYEGNTIALNDIGAVNYYNDIYCVDLWGLANKEVADLRRKRKYNLEKIFEICKDENAETAIIFESWFEKYGGVPKSWYLAGKWTIPNNITCGADSVTFYATDSTGYLKLRENLKQFSTELPKPIKQSEY